MKQLYVEHMNLVKNINLCKFKLLWLIIASIFMAPGFAQEADSETEESAQTGNSSTETEVSEDNYRRFMELKDQPGERSLPTAAFVKPPSLEKMQGLPETSQKHLRNELREVILQGGQWSPEQIEIEHPYNPSEGALEDKELQDQESEAWDELVSEYHEREADIYAHSARAQAASMPSDSGDGNPANESGQQGQQGQQSQQSQEGSNQSGQMGGNGEGEGEGDGEDGDGEGQQSASAAARAAASSAENASESANSVESKGVSQNAFEFLQGMGAGSGTPDKHKYLNGKQLRKLLIGNTPTGTYPVEDAQVKWFSFNAPTGILYWIDEFGNQFDGTWDITDDGCYFLDFDDTDEGDGCYYYIDNGDGSYTVTRPSSDIPGLQTIRKGNPLNLKALH
jgi:hypothetical protein